MPTSGANGLMTRVRAGGLALMRLWVKLLAGISWLASRVFGEWQWQAPAWLGWTGARSAKAWHFVTADRKRVAIVLAALACAAGGWYWYKNRPVPQYVTYTVSEPALTEYGDTG